MLRVTDHIRSFFAMRDNDDDDFELPLDESGKLIPSLGSVRTVPHSFRDRNGVSGNQPADQLHAVLPLDDESRALLELAKAVRDNQCSTELHGITLL